MRNSTRVAGLLVLAAMLAAAGMVCAQTYPEPSGFVNDFAGELGSGESQQLEALGREVREKARIELAFVTMDSIPDGGAISMYATELAHHWGVGSEGDRGALLLYSTGRADGRRQVFLATGYGLEGAIPDARAGQILDEITIPRLRLGRVFEAFAATAAVIVQQVEPTVQLTGAVPQGRMQPRESEGPGIVGLLFMIGMIALMSSSRMGRGMLFGMLLGSLMGGHRGRWGGGGGFGGGGFGGGFGGFGGGGFGGGGAGRGF